MSDCRFQIYRILSEALDRTVRGEAKSDFGSDWDRTIRPWKSGNPGSCALSSGVFDELGRFFDPLKFTPCLPFPRTPESIGIWTNDGPLTFTGRDER